MDCNGIKFFTLFYFFYIISLFSLGSYSCLHSLFFIIIILYSVMIIHFFLFMRTKVLQFPKGLLELTLFCLSLLVLQKGLWLGERCVVISSRHHLVHRCWPLRRVRLRYWCRIYRVYFIF
jgi:hypothetical protein